MEYELSRTESLIGKKSLYRLTKKRVAIFGIGGVGGYAVEALARSGIGIFDLFDNDTISISNLNRQIIATYDTIGEQKTTVMKKRILSVNKNAIVYEHIVFYLPENASDYDFTQYDYIIDAVDTITAKLDIIEQAYKAKTPVISAMGAGNKLNPCAFEVADIYQTSVCPLAKVLRRELKKRNIPSLKVVYSKEPPVKTRSEKTIDTRNISPGSISYVPSVAGLILASEVIKDLSNSTL